MLWYLKQLLPMVYWTTYVEDGRKHFVIWHMWFGHSYDITDFVIGG